MTETHRAAYPAKYHVEPKPAKPAKPVKPRKKPVRAGSCLTECTGGNKCICNPNYLHEWHICQAPECQCHQEHKGKVVR